MNRINYKCRRRALLAISGLFAALLIRAGNVEASNAGTSTTGTSITGTSEIQVGRYQTVMLQPDEEQVDLLSAVVTRSLPEHVNTVGQAVATLLNGSANNSTRYGSARSALSKR